MVAATATNGHRPIKTQQLAVSSLKPHPQNPRVGNVEVIKDSLRAHGQFRAIVVRADTREVLAGNHTLKAARELGWDRILCHLVDADDDQARRIMLADNRASDLGAYDDAALAALLQDLPDLDGTGFDHAALNQLLASTAPARPAPSDDPPAPPDEPVTQRGDLIQCGAHRLLCGDATSRADVERLMDGARAALVVTSPPYASQRKYDESSGFRPIPPDEYVAWFDAVQANIGAALAADGSYMLNIKEHCEGGQRHLYVKDLTIAHVRAWGWRFIDEFCWRDTKNGVPGGWSNRFKDAWEPVFHFARSPRIKMDPHANGSTSDHVFGYSPDTAKAGTGSGLLGSEKATPYETGSARPSNVLEIAAASTGGMPAVYPVDLPRWFIRAFTDPGDVVLDPFAGSGSTLMAADAEGRACCTMEISPAYCDVVVERWQQHTGEKAVRP